MTSALGPRAWVVFAAALLLFFISSGFAHPTAYNNYVLLADAWLHGRVWIYQPSPAIDALEYVGRYFIIEAPLPAALMLPLVAIFGADANQTLVAIVCAAAFVAATDVALGRMGVKTWDRGWLVAFCATGTALWWCASFPAVWMFAHISAAAFLMFALAEWYGLRRSWLLGLFVACAALSRFPTILAALPLVWWMWAESPADERVKKLFSFAAGAAPLFCLYAAYNFARWHTLGDIGYTLWYHQDQVGQPTGSPFRLQYLPFNLYSFFILGPEFVQSFPWLRPTGLGVSLTLTSPALLLAFGAPLASRETRALWAMTALVALPSMLYYVNGFEQFGMRHALDFLPPLLLLCARGMERFPRLVALGLIVFSILANAYGEWFSWTYHGFTVVPRF